MTRYVPTVCAEYKYINPTGQTGRSLTGQSIPCYQIAVVEGAERVKGWRYSL